MFYTVTTPGNQAQDKKTRAMKRAMLLASTVLLTMPQSVLADETYNTGLATIDSSADRSNENLYVGYTSRADLTINDGAIVQFGATSIGSQAGAIGSVTLTQGAKLTSVNNVNVGQFGNGLLAVEDGGQFKGSSISIATYDGSAAAVNVSGDGSSLDATYDLIVGDQGNASFTVENGADASSSYAYIAGQSGESSMTVSGAGSTFDVTNSLTVGHGGIGTLLVEGGGVVSSGEGLVGGVIFTTMSTLYGTGTVTVTGAGSAWHNTSGLTVGGGGSGTLTIANDGQVTVGAVDSNTGLYDGTITVDSGSRGGVVNIGGAMNSPAVAAGQLLAEELLFSSPGGQLNFNHTDTNYEFSSDIKGPGQIYHYAGITKLSSDGSLFTGTTNIGGGTLDVTGELGGTVGVYTGGTLGGTGTVGDTTLWGGSTLSPGLHTANNQTRGALSPIGTLTIDGDLELASNTTYAVDLSSEIEDNSTLAISDRVDVTGKLTIDSGAVVRVTALDSQTDYHDTQIYKIMTAGSNDTGGFSQVVNNSAFLDVQTYTEDDGKNVYLRVALKSNDAGDTGGGAGSGDSGSSGGDGSDTGAGTGPVPDDGNDDDVFTSIAKNSNQRSLASALDSLDRTTGSASLALYNSLLILDVDQAQEAYEQLSGDVYATAQGAFTQTNRAVNTALNGRVRAVTDGVAAPSSMALGYAEEKKEPVKDERFAAFEPKKTFDTDRFATWINGFGSWGKVDGTDGASDTDVSNGGVLVGGDVGLGKDWRVGLLGGYSRSFFDSENSDGNSTNYHLGSYAGTKWGAVSFRTGMNYTWHDVSTTRNVTVLGQTLQGAYDASSLNAYGELAYRVDLGKSALEPFASLAHTRMKTDGFSEIGGNAALTVASSTMNTTYTTAGLRASKDFELGSVASVVRGTVGWMHAYGDVNPVSTARFASGDSFSVSSTPVDRNTALLEAGVDFTVTPSSTISVSYNGQVGSNAYDHGANAKFRVKF